jgi:transposase
LALRCGASACPFDRALVAAGYVVSKASLDRWMGSVRKGTSVSSGVEKRGRRSKLSEDQVNSVVGFDRGENVRWSMLRCLLNVKSRL